MAAMKEPRNATAKEKPLDQHVSGTTSTRQRARAGKDAGVVARHARRGIRPQSHARAEDLRAEFGFTQEQFAELLGVDLRTYTRRASGNLKGSESLLVEMLEGVLEEATRVFRDAELARRWLRSPIISLDNERPIDWLDSIEGYERVKNTLGKIEYGMY